MMESFVPLGCILNKSSTKLTLTSSLKERITISIITLAIGIACFIIIIITPYNRIGLEGLIIFCFIGTIELILAFVFWLCKTEIEFDISQKQIIRYQLCLKRKLFISILPLEQLHSIRVVKKGKSAGELQIIQQGNKIWTRWSFFSHPLAQEICNEILMWLKNQTIYTSTSGERSIRDGNI